MAERLMSKESASRILLAAMLCMMLGCSPREVEVARISSSDHLVDAVLIERETDATVSTPYLVYLVPTGEKKLETPILLGDHFDNLKLVWKGPRMLEIEYSREDIQEFTNFWGSSE